MKKIFAIITCMVVIAGISKFALADTTDTDTGEYLPCSGGTDNYSDIPSVQGGDIESSQLPEGDIPSVQGGDIESSRSSGVNGSGVSSEARDGSGGGSTSDSAAEMMNNSFKWNDEAGTGGGTVQGPDGSSWTNNPNDKSMTNSAGDKAYYNSDGTLAGVTRADGTREYYDQKGDLGSITSKDGTSWTNNPDGSMTNSAGDKAYYNSGGVLSGVTRADGTKESYDQNGNLASAVDKNGNPLKLDGQGNIINSNGTITPGLQSLTMVPNNILGARPVMMMSGTGMGGGVGSWMSNLLGLTGGINYNSRTGFSGGLGFGSTSGYGMATGGNTVGGIGGYGGGLGGGYYGGGGGYGTGAMMGGAMGGGGWNPANYISTGLPAGSIYAIIMNVAMWFLGVFGFIAIIGFIISGIMYLVAAGDEKSQEKAKKAMYYSITGVIVGLIGLVVIFAVHALLQGASFF